jgi:hypothetical protein
LLVSVKFKTSRIPGFWEEVAPLFSIVLNCSQDSNERSKKQKYKRIDWSIGIMYRNLASFLALAATVSGASIGIDVGQDGSLKFNPDSVTAAMGDT